jgi:hypothetical protein
MENNQTKMLKLTALKDLDRHRVLQDGPLGDPCISRVFVGPTETKIQNATLYFKLVSKRAKIGRPGSGCGQAQLDLGS